MVVGNQDIAPLDVADKVEADKAVVDRDVADKVEVDMDVADKVEADMVDMVVGMAVDRNYQEVFLYLQQ